MPRILAIPRTHVPALPRSGCWPVAGLGFPQSAFWRERAAVEHDESLLQPIVYLVLRNASGHAWRYQRAGGDARVDGCWSCGVGGHVDAADAADADAIDPAVAGQSLHLDATLRQALLRELEEELHGTADAVVKPRLRALIYEGVSAIGRVHLGVLYTAQWVHTRPPQPRAGEALQALGFLTLDAIAADSRFELWSRLAARHLMAGPQPQ